MHGCILPSYLTMDLGQSTCRPTCGFCHFLQKLEKWVPFVDPFGVDGDKMADKQTLSGWMRLDIFLIKNL